MTASSPHTFIFAFYKNPWNFQVNLSEQHTKYSEAIISFYGMVGADFFNFSTTQLCGVL